MNLQKNILNDFDLIFIDRAQELYFLILRYTNFSKLGLKTLSPSDRKKYQSTPFEINALSEHGRFYAFEMQRRLTEISIMLGEILLIKEKAPHELCPIEDVLIKHVLKKVEKIISDNKL
jgi:hypothetical protein